MNIRRLNRDNTSLSLRRVSMLDGGVSMSARIQELQKKLSLNMSKAVLLAKRNTIRNEQGYVVLSKDDEWRDEDEWEE